MENHLSDLIWASCDHIVLAWVSNALVLMRNVQIDLATKNLLLLQAFYIKYNQKIQITTKQYSESYIYHIQVITTNRSTLLSLCFRVMQQNSFYTGETMFNCLNAVECLAQLLAFVFVWSNKLMWSIVQTLFNVLQNNLLLCIFFVLNTKLQLWRMFRICFEITFS